MSLTAQQISSGALYSRFNGLTLTLKKSSDSNGVSAENRRTAKRQSMQFDALKHQAGKARAAYRIDAY